MSTYANTTNFYNKIMTPLLKSKKIEITPNHTRSNLLTENNNNSLYYNKNNTHFNERERKRHRDKSSSISTITNVNIDYDSKRKGSHIPPRRIDILKQMSNENEQHNNNSNYDNFTQMLYYNTNTNNNEEYNEIKRERDNAFNEIIELQEINKSLRLDYTDAMIKIKDYERAHVDLENKIVLLEEFKEATAQMEVVSKEYQDKLNQLNGDIEVLMNNNLQLENTNKKLLFDLNKENNTNREIRRQNIKKKSGKSIKSSNSNSNISSSNRNQIKKIEHDNNTLAIIYQIENENREMNVKVDNIEEQIDYYLQKNKIVIDKHDDSNNNKNDESHIDSLNLIIQSLFAFVNSINDVFKQEHLFIEDYISNGDIIKLVSVLDDLLQILYSSLVSNKGQDKDNTEKT